MYITDAQMLKSGLGLWRQKPVFTETLVKTVRNLFMTVFLSKTVRNCYKLVETYPNNTSAINLFALIYLFNDLFLITLESLWKENKHTLYFIIKLICYVICYLVMPFVVT